MCVINERSKDQNKATKRSFEIVCVCISLITLVHRVYVDVLDEILDEKMGLVTLVQLLETRTVLSRAQPCMFKRKEGKQEDRPHISSQHNKTEPE